MNEVLTVYLETLTLKTEETRVIHEKKLLSWPSGPLDHVAGLWGRFSLFADTFKHYEGLSQNIQNLLKAALLPSPDRLRNGQQAGFVWRLNLI